MATEGLQLASTTVRSGFPGLSTFFMICVIFSSGIEISPFSVSKMTPKQTALVPGVINFLVLMVRPNVQRTEYNASYV